MFSPRRFLGACGLRWGKKISFPPTLLSCWLRPSEQKTDGPEKSPQLLIPLYCHICRHEDQKEQLNSVIFLLRVMHSELSWRKEAGSVFTHRTSAYPAFHPTLAYPAIPLGREGILSPGQGRIACIQGSFVLFRIRGPPASTISHIFSV